MAVRLAVMGVLAVLLVWRAGCAGDGSSPVEHGSAGESSVTTPGVQEGAASEAASPSGGSLTALGGTFLDSDGHARRLAEFRGRAWVASAIYTRCVMVCPRVVEEMLALDRAWSADTSC